MDMWGLNIETVECTRGSHYRALEVLVLREAVMFLLCPLANAWK